MQLCRNYVVGELIAAVYNYVTLTGFGHSSAMLFMSPLASEILIKKNLGIPGDYISLVR